MYVLWPWGFASHGLFYATRTHVGEGGQAGAEFYKGLDVSTGNRWRFSAGGSRPSENR